jgi:hypothetical protein
MGNHHVRLNIAEDGLVKSVGETPQYETCILCGAETNIPISRHIDQRVGYIEGAGQMCIDCYTRGSSDYREMIQIPKNMVLGTPNDMQLGALVRSYYYEYYGDPVKSKAWICEYCGKDTSHVDNDYLVGQNHLNCALEHKGSNLE